MDKSFLKETKVNGVGDMEICDPEIFRTEKFGSRENASFKKSVCRFCGKEIFDEFFCDISGNVFCDRVCREKRDKKEKGIKT